MTYKYQRENFDFQWETSDIVNPTDFIHAGDFNPHNIHAFVMHDAGFVVAVVFASHLQYALNTAVNESSKLDRFQVSESELKDYETGERESVGSEHCPEGYPVYEGIVHLGNASEPFDIESLDVFEISDREWTEKLNEDPDLMTFDRVCARLREREEEFEEAYRRVSVDDKGWTTAYQNRQDAEEALIFYFLHCMGK